MTFEEALTAKPEFSGVSGHMVGETGANAANGLGDVGAAWLPIESAPKNAAGEFLGPTILIYCTADELPWPAYWGPSADSRIDGAWMCADDDAGEFRTEDVTHWMPLPPAPTPQEARHD